MSALRTRTLRIGHRLAPPPAACFHGPDWTQASNARIERALDYATALPSGGWYAVDASKNLATGPKKLQIAGYELTCFRDASGLVIGPDACPHLGAELSRGKVCDGKVVCPWHGLALGRQPHGSWQPLPVFDDGVLTWVRLDFLHAPGSLSARPYLPARPANFLEATVRVEARCEPSDVLKNRLDPWHGAHFHPYAFAKLRVTEADEKRLVLRVEYRVLGPATVEVDAAFHCPDPRSIVMTILEGEGKGSVVETHATPLATGRTAILETTLATSERLGFRAARLLSPLVRPLMRRAALRLWKDDAAYAERGYALRTAHRGEPQQAFAADGHSSGTLDANGEEARAPRRHGLRFVE